MPKGDSLKRYWEKYRNGEVQLGENHGKRGKDKPGTVRKISSNDKTLATRYYERTGRRLDVEMENQRDMIQMMFDAASEIGDPEKRMDALYKAQQAMATFNQTFLPYMEQKLGELKSESTVEQKMSLDDVLDDNYEIAQDKSQEITDETG